MSRGPRLRKALILDDDQLRRTELCEQLAVHGVVSEQAATLEEAIRLLAVERYDLVVCDMVLCDPPDTPTTRGYLAVCYALALHPGSVVVQSGTHQRWRHAGAVLATGGQQVADLVYGAKGDRVAPDAGAGCPWTKLEEAESAIPVQRHDAVRGLVGLPVMEALSRDLQLGPVFEALQHAAHGNGSWLDTVADARAALFPGLANDA